MIDGLLPTPPSVANVDLDALWERVRRLLDLADDQALGAVRVGLTDQHEKPWAQTNDGEDQVNLTLELKPEQLELNLVGWKEEQSEALKNWLQSVPGEKAVNALEGYEVVAFARRAYKKTPTSRPWWQDEDHHRARKVPRKRFQRRMGVHHSDGNKEFEGGEARVSHPEDLVPSRG